MGVSGQRHAPATLPAEVTRYSMYRVGLRAGLRGRGKSCPPPGFDPPTVKPVASRYADYVVPAHS